MDLLLLPLRGMSALKIARLTRDDVFPADETKVHTLSRQAIAEMLDDATRKEKLSSVPPPPSGIRTVAHAPPLPVTWNDEDEGLEPTRLSERMIGRPPLVTQLMSEAPVARLISQPPVIIQLPAAVDGERGPAALDARSYAAPAGADVRALAIGAIAFFATLVAGLTFVYFSLAR